jgi:hypothetical protein
MMFAVFQSVDEAVQDLARGPCVGRHITLTDMTPHTQIGQANMHGMIGLFHIMQSTMTGLVPTASDNTTR